MPNKIIKVLFDAIVALGALACIFVWLEIKPKDLAAMLTLPHVWWLIGALVLFGISLWSSLRSLYLTTTTVRKLKLEHAEAQRRMSPFADAKTKLKIRSASYGAGDPNDVDVTDTLSKMIPRDALAVMVDNNLIAGLPDPAPNVPKALTVHYTFGTSDVVPVVVKEHSLLILPLDFAYAHEQGLIYEQNRLNQIAKLTRDCDARVALEERTRKLAEEQFRQELNKSEERAQAELIRSVALEAGYLVTELEKIKDMNDKEPEERRIDLLYPIKGDQFGERSTWRWQHEYLLRWKVAYERLCVHCMRVKLTFGFWPVGSPVNYSALLRRLSDASKGLFPLEPLDVLRAESGGVEPHP
jgi:hypothetical protein